MSTEKNYYTKLDNSTSSGFESGSTAFGYDKRLIIGGVNFGYKWTDADAAALQHMQLEAQYQAQLEQREYESPLKQAQRLRAAGINPNLLNGVIDNGNGSINSSVGSPTGSPAIASSQAITSMIGQMVNLLPQAIQMYQSLTSNSISNAIGEAELSKLSRGEALDLIGQQVTLSDLKDKSTLPYVSTNGIANKRYRKLVQKNIDYFLNDASNREQAISSVYRVKQGKEHSRNSFISSVSGPNWNDSDSLFISALRELHSIEQEATKAQNKYNKDYYTAKDGSIVGNAEESIVQSTQTITSNQSTSSDSVVEAHIGELLKSDDRGDRALGAILYLLKSLTGSYTGVNSGGSFSIGK